MIYDRFRVSLIIQAILIALVPILFIWTIKKETTLVTTIFLICLWVFMVLYLIYYINKTNRELSGFIRSLEHKDYSRNYNVDNESKIFKELYQAFNQISHSILKARIEKETEHQYFLNTIQHVGTGLVSFDETGKVEIFNTTASMLLNKNRIRNIKELQTIKKDLPAIFSRLKHKQTELIKIDVNKGPIQLSIKAVEFVIEGRKIKLISLQNITSEMEQGEVDAWQRLIKVLNHEIVNSLSPINLLSSTLIDYFEENGRPKPGSRIDDRTIQNSIEGLKAIEKRSKGLKKFIESFGNLTSDPEVNFSIFLVMELFQNISVLLKNELLKRNINLVLRVKPLKLYLNADEKLIEQVLINLIQNSIKALENTLDPKITLSANKQGAQTIIEVVDNGDGIEEEIMENIFVPFFSTRKNGTGLGLSTSRQIMKLHKGTIAARSQAGIETTISLVF